MIFWARPAASLTARTEPRPSRCSVPTFLMTVPEASLVRVTRMFGRGYQRNSSAPGPPTGRAFGADDLPPEDRPGAPHPWPQWRISSGPA